GISRSTLVDVLADRSRCREMRSGLAGVGTEVSAKQQLASAKPDSQRALQRRLARRNNKRAVYAT
ncbi:MAG: hypothetical protein MUC83_02750, partial [Pirellula sp.]|nr:hypothetical protein [Pirellula sp.]